MFFSSPSPLVFSFAALDLSGLATDLLSSDAAIDRRRAIGAPQRRLQMRSHATQIQRLTNTAPCEFLSRMEQFSRDQLENTTTVE